MSSLTFINRESYPVTVSLNGETYVVPPGGTVSPVGPAELSLLGGSTPLMSNHVSFTSANPPDAFTTGTRGFRRTSDNRLQGLQWSGALWEAVGEPFGGSGSTVNAAIPSAAVMDATVYSRLIALLTSVDGSVTITGTAPPGVASTNPILLVQVDVELLSFFYSSDDSVVLKVQAPGISALASTELRLAIRASAERLTGSSDNSLLLLGV